MAWIQICIDTTADKADEIGDLLFEKGCLSVTYTNAATSDNPLFELTPGDVEYWRDTTVIGLFDAAVETNQLTATLRDQPAFSMGLHCRFEQVEDKDWEREWMANFHPMQFGERLWICPSWCDIPDPDACNVILDPGLAFGTGTHETTALCLEWLEAMDLAGKTVLDFGCGSGILAIAALKLGASRAIGIDIDPKAIIASRENSERNGISNACEWYLPQDAPECKADVVVANVLAEPLKALKQNICAYAYEHGAVALSGILDTQVEAIENDYAELLKLDVSVRRGQWARVSGISLT